MCNVIWVIWSSLITTLFQWNIEEKMDLDEVSRIAIVKYTRYTGFRLGNTWSGKSMPQLLE